MQVRLIYLEMGRNIALTTRDDVARDLRWTRHKSVHVSVTGRTKLLLSRKATALRGHLRRRAFPAWSWLFSRSTRRDAPDTAHPRAAVVHVSTCIARRLHVRVIRKFISAAILVVNRLVADARRSSATCCQSPSHVGVASHQGGRATVDSIAASILARVLVVVGVVGVGARGLGARITELVLSGPGPLLVDGRDVRHRLLIASVGCVVGVVPIVILSVVVAVGVIVAIATLLTCLVSAAVGVAGASSTCSLGTCSAGS